MAHTRTIAALLGISLLALLTVLTVADMADWAIVITLASSPWECLMRKRLYHMLWAECPVERILLSGSCVMTSRLGVLNREQHSTLNIKLLRTAPAACAANHTWLMLMLTTSVYWMAFWAPLKMQGKLMRAAISCSWKITAIEYFQMFRCAVGRWEVTRGNWSGAALYHVRGSLNLSVQRAKEIEPDAGDCCQACRFMYGGEGGWMVSK